MLNYTYLIKARIRQDKWNICNASVYNIFCNHFTFLFKCCCTFRRYWKESWQCPFREEPNTAAIGNARIFAQLLLIQFSCEKTLWPSINYPKANGSSVVSKPLLANGSIFFKSGVMRAVSYPGHTQSKGDSIGLIYLCHGIMGMYFETPDCYLIENNLLQWYEGGLL